MQTIARAPLNDNDLTHTRISFARPPLRRDEAFGHYLLVLEGAEPGRIIEIGAESVSIGRDRRQTIAIADGELSRFHARISIVGDEVIAEDLGSTNGTLVDGQRITSPTRLSDGSVLHLGQQVLKYERHERRDIERRLELNRDLLKASSYVRSLLPEPIPEGRVRVDWRFLPSAQLGGDAFGYHWLDGDVFVVYLMDVSGHGVGAAMHSIGVLNLIRQRALPGVDFAEPPAVLAALNDRFQMDKYGEMYFTLWYGVYSVSARTLAYSAAGHHAAYLVPDSRTISTPLGIQQLAIGAGPDVVYEARQTTVPPGSRLYIFSDGAFEIVTKEQAQWRLSDFLPHLVASPLPGTPESERLLRIVKDRARLGLLDDDFSLVSVAFS